MEPLSDIELQDLREAGELLSISLAWESARAELERRRQGVVGAAFLGKLDTYEQYIEKRAEYRALTQMIDLPSDLMTMGA